MNRVDVQLACDICGEIIHGGIYDENDDDCFSFSDLDYYFSEDNHKCKEVAKSEGEEK